MATTGWSLSSTSEGGGDYHRRFPEKYRFDQFKFKIRRIPSIAVSLSMHGPQDQREQRFHLAATVSELLARSMAEGEMPPGLTLNVNVPNVPRGEIRGIAVTTHIEQVVF